MVRSNERGRAFEYLIRKKILDFASAKGTEVEETKRAMEKDKIEQRYFEELSEELKENYEEGAKLFMEWIDEQNWLKNSERLILDRVPDDEAKKADVTDIRLEILAKGEKRIRNISVKHRHDALCHPRLPSLAQQCGMEKGAKQDKEYRKKYSEIWNEFFEKVKKLGGGLSTTTAVNKKYPEFITENLYYPLQLNAIAFLEKHANNKKNSAEFFSYLTGTVRHCVLKNENKCIKIKHFSDLEPPKSFKITYPYENRKTTFLIEFDNGWKITLRLHTATSQLIKKNGEVKKSEKWDPICINQKEVIKIEKIEKKN